VLDHDGVLVGGLVKEASLCQLDGRLSVKEPALWWPWTMSPNPGIMYTLLVNVSTAARADVYLQPFGIRTVSVSRDKFLINGEPFYFHGFGRHEDYEVRWVCPLSCDQCSGPWARI